MTQRQVADLFGQTPANISHYENGNQDLPPKYARLLIDAAQVSGVSITFDDVYACPAASGETAQPERQAA